MFIFFILNILGIYGINEQEHTYPTGADYSTIKIQDFKIKDNNRHRLWKKIRSLMEV
jgi:hypothetical protein